VKQIESFNVRNRNVEEDLIYKFCIPTGIKNGNNPMRFLRYSDTFTPIIVGNWEVSMENASEAANYTFKCFTLKKLRFFILKPQSFWAVKHNPHHQSQNILLKK
jgi:hypothetical protein